MLKNHMLIHSDVSFICQECNKAFRSKNALLHHVMVHTGDNPFGFSVCEKRFTHQCYLRCHFVNSHDKKGSTKKYVCNICSKTLVSSQSLKFHLAVHRDERPFSCSLCDKLFRRKHHLELHIKTHDGKNHTSAICCNKQFRCSSSLKYHEKIHKGEKQFSCSRCSLHFRTSKALSGHFARKHAEVRKFPCRICEIQFGINADLQKHMKRSHSVARVCLICNVQVQRTDCFRKHMLTHKR